MEPAATSTKVVLLGDASVGNTTLFNRVLNIPGATRPSVQGQSGRVTVALASGTVVLDLWDTPGTEQYQSLAMHYCRNTRVCVLVFDVTAPQTLDSLAGWRNMILEWVTSPQFVVVGNKCDLEKADGLDGGGAASQMGATYIEVSAETGLNVRETFECVAEIVREIMGSSAPQTVAIDEPPGEQHSRPVRWLGGCCTGAARMIRPAALDVLN
jgi:small GTP-binding protein